MTKWIDLLKSMVMARKHDTVVNDDFASGYGDSCYRTSAS